MVDVLRIGAPEVARHFGWSLRGAQALAAQGKIPGATMLGGRWSFDPVKLKQWIEDLENATAQLASARPSRKGGAQCTGGHFVPSREQEGRGSL